MIDFVADVSARAFYEPLLVIDFLAKHFRFNLSRLSDQDRIKVIFYAVWCDCWWINVTFEWNVDDDSIVPKKKKNLKNINSVYTHVQKIK